LMRTARLRQKICLAAVAGSDPKKRRVVPRPLEQARRGTTSHCGQALTVAYIRCETCWPQSSRCGGAGKMRPESVENHDPTPGDDDPRVWRARAKAPLPMICSPVQAGSRVIDAPYNVTGKDEALPEAQKCPKGRPGDCRVFSLQQHARPVS